MTSVSSPVRLPGVVARLLDSRVLRWLLLALFVAVLAKRLAALHGLGTDSWGAMRAALDFLDSHDAGNLFQVVFFENGIKFQYPPSSLLFIEPLHAAGLDSNLVLNSINFIAYGLNAVVIALLAGRLATGWLSSAQVQTVRSAALLLAVMYEPIVLGYAIGQIQVFLNLLFSASCLLLVSGRERSSGVLLGLATTIKPQFGPLLLTQAALKRGNFVLGFLACAAAVGLLSLWRYGWDSHVSYLKVLQFLSERGEAYHLNASVNGIAHRVLGNGSSFEDVATMGILQSALPPFHPVVAILTRIAMIGFLAIPFLVLWRVHRAANELLVFCLAATCFVVASPIAWIHHYGILLPVYLIVLRDVCHDRRRTAPSVVLLAISFLLTGGRFPALREAEGWQVLLQPASLVFAGACLLVGILVRRTLVTSRSYEPGAAASVDVLPAKT
ncbi:MAG TPA: glycosyltransferase family 87 protein [Steroidobacter sp.]|uniref:glycosyltransferase family 87 protein n=1 Tax=Steroidobacter sp. TaxID=1978227 RepID=UPI002ED97736